jgi:hypothetical protein
MVMKNINIYLEDEEFEELVKIKGDMTWHDLLLTLRKNNAQSA